MGEKFWILSGKDANFFETHQPLGPLDLSNNDNLSDLVESEMKQYIQENFSQQSDFDEGNNSVIMQSKQLDTLHEVEESEIAIGDTADTSTDIVKSFIEELLANGFGMLSLWILYSGSQFELTMSPEEEAKRYGSKIPNMHIVPPSSQKTSAFQLLKMRAASLEQEWALVRRCGEKLGIQKKQSQIKSEIRPVCQEAVA
eukprot:Filipodium_phascolosomae@DN7472_c0_g1_i1.p1